MKPWRLALLLLVAGVVGQACGLADPAAAGQPPKTMEEATQAQVDRGRYLLRIAGCNDCHTKGYLLADGQVAEESWLLGDTFGWRGPWGTTYGTNLRLFVSALDLEQWIALAHNLKARPPMPWFNLNALERDDLTAIYLFLRHLGPAGQPAPAYLPPDQEPQPPYALFPPAPQ